MGETMAGRPRSFDRGQALDVAVEHFWREGYDETTMSSLTQAMGIAAPSLYAAFGDKEQLFAEAARCYSASIGENMDAAFAGVSARDGLTAMIRMTAAAHTDPATPLGCFVLTEPRLTAERAALTDRMAGHIERGVRDGELPPGTDAGQLAGFLVAVLGGMSARARDGGSAEDVNAIAELALRALP
jgi:AcrR family transcriptional regulator